MNIDADTHAQSSATLYQLIGPIEHLYQLVPINNSRRQDSQELLLVPLQQREQPFIEDLDEEFGGLQLVGPIGNELVLFDEGFLQLAPPNELDAPIQLLAIEGPPQFQIVGPVPRLARIRCRFSNGTSRILDLVWTDNSRMYRYAKLDYDEFIDITTFEGHQWIFCDALDGDLYVITPSGTKKYVAASDTGNGGRRVYVRAVPSVHEMTLKRIALRILAKKIFDFWYQAAREDQFAPQTQMDILIRNLHLPLFIQVQLAQFVLSCLIYQTKFECAYLAPVQRQMLDWLLNFIRTKARINFD